jgi:hypothetical protein
MAETIEYVLDPKTKTYIIQRGFVGRGPRAIQKQTEFVESLTQSQVAAMGLRAIKSGDKFIVEVPIGKARTPEARKEKRANKPQQVDPVTLKPVAKTKSKIGESTPFLEYGDYEWGYDTERQVVTPKVKPGQKPGDLPESGLLLNALDPATNQMKLTVVSADEFTRGLRKEFIQNPDRVSQYKQLLKDAGWYDGPIDNRTDPVFLNRLREVGGLATDWNYYSSTVDNGPVYSVDEYLKAMAAGGGGGLTRTTTTLSTADDIYSALNQQFEKYTGRRVPDNVLDEFVQRVNALERQSPTVQTTTGDNTVVSGGAGGIADREAVQFAREQKGAGAYRGATYYLDALMAYVNRGTPGA